MTLAGNLSAYSLAEIFNFVHEGSRTGMLEIAPDSKSAVSHADYLWFEGGRIIAATTGLGGTDLFTKIERRKLVPPAQLDLLKHQLHQLPQALGLYLKSRGLLDADQLKLLYNSQTIATVCTLFEFQDREFSFAPDKLPANAELTGISLPAREVGILGLRVLKNWSGLAAKLPAPEYTVQRWSAQQPDFRLDRHELQLWKLADGESTLAQLAQQMGQPIDIVCQSAFRLISFRLLQEIPTEPTPIISEELAVSVLDPEYKNPQISTSFLGSLKKFLKKGGDRSSKTLVK